MFLLGCVCEASHARPWVKGPFCSKWEKDAAKKYCYLARGQTDQECPGARRSKATGAYFTFSDEICASECFLNYSYSIIPPAWFHFDISVLKVSSF